MRLIDGNALYEKTAEWESLAMETLKVQEDNAEWQRWQTILTERTAFKYDVADAPTIDAVPVVHGNWITKEYMYGDPDVGLEDMWVDRLAEATDYYAECSMCGKNAGYDGEGSLILSDFCPSCGAKMDGGDSSD